MDIVNNIVRPHLRTRRSEPLPGHYEPQTETIGLVVPENAVSVLLQAPETRRLMVETQYGAAALSAGSSVENSIKQRELVIGLQAVQESAGVQVLDPICVPTPTTVDQCRATMRTRRCSG
jgi:hypothetical protein